jgi:5,10-methylene-tetrahydrofolate dehydrogenase/methenyl tetrahydrofolate cyclohydrolase
MTIACLLENTLIASKNWFYYFILI